MREAPSDGFNGVSVQGEGRETPCGSKGTKCSGSR
jgi:hypothetical protein